MTKKLRDIMKKQSEQRSKLNTLSALEELTAPQVQEQLSLRESLTASETEYRAALDEQAEERDVELDTEDREKLELRAKSRFASYVRAAVNGKTLDGVEAEMSAAHGCPGTVPYAMFEPERRGQGQVEERAVTPGPATAATSFAPIVPALFQRSLMAWLGIDMPTVGVGDKSYPVLSTSLQADPKAKAAASDEGAGAFTVTTVVPRRVVGSFKFNREDAARLDGMESALQQNLQAVVNDQLDNQGINGTATGDGTLKGLLAILGAITAPVAEVETFARFVAAFGSHVDGVFATDLMGIRAAVGAETYRLMVSTFRADANDATAESWATTRTGGIRVSNRIPAKVQHVQKAIIRRTNPAGDAVAVMPVWEGLELIRDPYTGAGKGEIVVTGMALVGDVVPLRGDAFVGDSFRVSKP